MPTERVEMLEEFGPFVAAFEKTSKDVAGHLALLNLFTDDVPEVLRRIQTIVRDSPDAPVYIDRMLSDTNWRPHLVAAAAVLLLPKPTDHHASLWAAIDRGSWVTPQLVVTAYLSDAGFIDRARSRITEPEGSMDRSAKMMVSLLTVCRRIESMKETVAAEASEREVKKLVRDDIDGAGTIVEEWLKSVVTHFDQVNVKLEPAVH